ncbi:hypothetical protein [Methanosarcina sp. Kolksee]|uniref:hypothetical protein n=1 Tax=Methanosarcina sp. Kolksee TaxID=1434099 RepID=UPI000AFDEB4E|nr:hypothetical protein [Methanosarcina sp. Kolksee]
MYIIAPIYLFTEWIPNSMYSIPRQIVPNTETGALVILLLIAIIFVVYKKATSIIFNKLQFNLKNEWIDYLTFKGWKIGYYKQLALTVTVLNNFCTSFFKLMNYTGEISDVLFKVSGAALIIFFYFLLGSSINHRIFGYNLWENKILLNYANNINMDVLDLILSLVFTIVITSIELFLLVILLLYIMMYLIKCMFPVVKYHGKMVMVDASDVPISFIKSAIEKLESFDFSGNFVQRQYKKNEITELISLALNYFIKVEDGKEMPDFTNICHVLLAGHLSQAAREDVLFRTNGLYKKMDEMCAEINNMNSPDDKNKIVQDLKMYLKMIEERNLSKIERVPYEIKKSNLVDFFIRTVVFLQKII